MAYQHILFEPQQGVARVTLNRPDVLNSFNRQMARELCDTLSTVAGDAALRAVLLTGAGRAFCAGQDLAEAAPRADGSLPDLGAFVRESYNPIVRAIRTLEKPVVCAVNGVAAGAGANLALACDIVMASSDASFIQSFAKIGVIPDSGGTFLLPRIVGLQRASALAMLAEKVSADQALEWGMVYHRSSKSLSPPRAIWPRSQRAASVSSNVASIGRSASISTPSSTSRNHCSAKPVARRITRRACGRFWKNESRNSRGDDGVPRDH